MINDINQKIDVFMPTVFKDMNKVKYSISSLIDNFPNLKDIHVCMPDKGNNQNVSFREHNIFFHNDLDVLPSINLRNCRFRPNWILQQLLKLCQNITDTRFTLIFDSDCILINKFNSFNNLGQVRLLSRVTKTDESAYFRFMNKMSNGDICDYITSEYAETHFIADMQIFDREVINEMINRYFSSKEEFIDFVVDTAYWKHNRTTSIFISEYELYGRYVTKYHLDSVFIDKLNMTDITKYQNTQQQQLFTSKDIEDGMVDAKRRGFDILKVQSSCGNVDTGNYIKTK